MQNQTNVAEFVVSQLADWGIKRIYGVAGNDVLPLIDALAHQDRVSYIGASHEAGAAFMASYEAKLTGSPGVCLASAPGVMNLNQGLMDAHLDGAPVLAITGQVQRSLMGTRTPQYFSHSLLLSQITAYSELVSVPESVPLLMSRAMIKAVTSGDVTHLAFPSDLWSLPMRAATCPMPGPMVCRASGGITGDFNLVLELLKRSLRPLIVVGRVGRECRETIRRLMTTLGAAVVVAQQARGIIPESWEGVLGGIGEAGTPDLVNRADLVLMVGPGSFEQAFLPAVTTLEVQRRMEDVTETRLAASLAGDIRHVLGLLEEGLRPDRKPNPDWLAAIYDYGTTHHRQQRGFEGQDEARIHPGLVVEYLNRYGDPNAVYCLDEGEFNHWFDEAFMAQPEQEVLLSHMWRSMGAALPAAVAAGLSLPGRRVIALVGDGGLLMSMGELLTVVKYRLPVTTIVFNNGCYALEREKMREAGMSYLGTDLTLPDFARLADACGARGFRVESHDRLEETLRAALEVCGPSVVDVLCADPPLPLMYGPPAALLPH